MSGYEYKCEDCDAEFQDSHSIKEDPAVHCHLCGAPARKLITGGGFYGQESPEGTDGYFVGVNREVHGGDDYLGSER